MCPHCDDYARTVVMLGDLALYADMTSADQHFVDVIGPSLAASLPEPPPGVFPAGYDPNEGPEYPGQGW
ncbi:hypothetical protein [Streptomyces beihaiensis]|uniref:Uncharacterized protein n=1 Tax=Streptomyces beihaiensis TaxID=2984495 RepID=A0ABT3TPC1_9ACTN|nr:hypothetical protein [Streptomyces beihaiensis]MCX3058879.1 hypothetical protein [Streptomyces beihaiensis]